MSEAFNPKNYSCNSCEFKAKSKAQLADHAKSKHKEKCSQCKKLNIPNLQRRTKHQVKTTALTLYVANANSLQSLKFN